MMKNIKWKHYISYIVLIACTILFSVLGGAKKLTFSTLLQLESATIAMILAASLCLVVGFLGELSLGHAGFMCVGAFIGGKLSVILTESGAMGENELLIMAVCLLAGGISAAVCGVIIGLPALRLRGDYLAIVTLAFGEIVRSLFRNAPAELFGGTLAMNTPRYDRNSLFIIGFILVLITVVVIQNFIRSKHGRAVTSIRDSEIAARATGINVTKYKLMVFTLSAFFAGIAGVLFSYSQFSVDSKKFDYNYSIQILVMVVLGGMGSVGGSLIAATAVVVLDTFLQKQLTGNLAVLKDMLYALVLIGLIVYRNAPALKGFREKWSIKNLMNKLKKHDPAKVHDDEANWDRVPTKIQVDEVLSVDVQTKSPYDPDTQWKEDT
ncbi:MAG: branched-chain amino acid ABC transporter permease [Oscillospiraceae bacterium]|nr:branched-chain amino acid ABC transporter permease [Oscillospiraceae bacterium]